MPKAKRAKSGKPKKSAALWGGRFASAAAVSMQAFSQSVSFDWRLYKQDIAGSLAHAAMLKKIGILTVRELAEITQGLRQIERQIDAGKFEWKTELEDVHMNIEAALTRRAPAGAKLHTGRSRNDQVATDMRLWLMQEIRSGQAAIRRLQGALVKLAERNGRTIIPGYTHLQRAQPVLLGHHLLAYVEMLERDHARLADSYVRTDVLPLGSGAIAGSTLPLDRAYVAKQLGFSAISQNSMDAVSDRDFIVEYCAAGALLAVHLSRLADDLILWCTPEFGFIRIGDAYTTGSSLMPQKKNPDAAELTRGKSGRVVGNLMALLTMLKGLPMTFNRDMQEDKERMFDTADTLRATLGICADMLGEVRINEARCRAAAADPLLLATDLADWFVRQGIPFRDAHHAVGKAVALSEKMGVPITELPAVEWKLISPKWNTEALKVFQLERAMQARPMAGAPGYRQLQAQLTRWKQILKKKN